MTTHDDDVPFRRALQYRITIGGRMLPLESGVLPPDFPAAAGAAQGGVSGLTWTAFAHALGVDRKQVRTAGARAWSPAAGAMFWP